MNPIKTKKEYRFANIRFTVEDHSKILWYAENTRHLKFATCIKAVILEHIDEFYKKNLPENTER